MGMFQGEKHHQKDDKKTQNDIKTEADLRRNLQF